MPAHAAVPHSLAALSDEALARLVSGGHRDAFGVLYSRHRDPLHRFCRGLLRSPEDAEEALQSAMLSAFTALRGEERTIAVRPWLYRIARNRCLDMLRRRDEEPLGEHHESPGSPVESADLRSRAARLRVDLDALPSRQRDALLMHELCGLSHREIAGALGTSPGAARQTVHEARSALVGLGRAEGLACSDARRRLAAGSAPRPAWLRTRAHLRRCPSCRSYASTLSRRRRDLAALIPPIVAPPAHSALGPLIEGGAAAGAIATAGAAGAGSFSSGGAAIAAAASAAAIAIGSTATLPADPAPAASPTPAPLTAPAPAATPQADREPGPARAPGRTGPDEPPAAPAGAGGGEPGEAEGPAGRANAHEDPRAGRKGEPSEAAAPARAPSANAAPTGADRSRARTNPRRAVTPATTRGSGGRAAVGRAPGRRSNGRGSAPAPAGDRADGAARIAGASGPPAPGPRAPEPPAPAGRPGGAPEEPPPATAPEPPPAPEPAAGPEGAAAGPPAAPGPPSSP